MRKFAIGKSVSAETEGEGSKPAVAGKKSWTREHWCPISLFAVILFAFAIRFVFAYGISAGGAYSLSGGSNASSHLRIVTEILAGTYDPSNQNSLNYPYGTESISGPFFDYAVATIAYVATLFGVSSSAAAAGALAWSAPILGALTCVPVFLLSKKLFKDETIGIVAALFYAIFVITITTSPFSNGTEHPMVCFLFAWLVYAVAVALEDADGIGARGIRSVLQEKKILKDAAIAGILLAMVCLSQSSSHVIMAITACIIGSALIINRISGRDTGVSVGIMDLALLMGIAVSAVYYIPSGLWNAVFSGECVLAILTAVFSTAFVSVEKRPWILTIPVFLIAIVVVAAILSFGFPDLAHAVVHGNNNYDNALMRSLSETFTRSSISSMASWFGWVTVWFPFALGIWMFCRFRKHSASRVYTFTMLLLLSMFFVGWFASDYAIIAASSFAAGAAAVLVRIARAVDVRAYLRSLKTIRGMGGRDASKKVFNFFPFVTVVAVICLIAAPAAVYGYDAATPANSRNAGYGSGIGYTIDTADSNIITSAWKSYHFDSDRALLTWYGYADSASSLGGVKTVVSPNGGGTYALSNALLGNGSAAAVSAMITRLMICNPEKITDGIFIDAGIDKGDATKLVGIAKGSENNDAYDSAYAVLGHYSLDTVRKAYEGVCDRTGHKIGYIEVDASMLPIRYNGGSLFPSIAYFGGYAADSRGAAKDFFSYGINGYATYTDAMYSTFLYMALLGTVPKDAGYSSVASYLSAVSANDGSIAVAPGSKLPGFELSYWHVMYNADSSATPSSGGWTEMDAKDAIEKQRANGGIINYLSSVMIYEYTETGKTVSGTVKAGIEAAPGVAVYVYVPDHYGGKPVIYGMGTTEKDGSYTVSAPSEEASYYVAFATGQSSVPGSGTVAGIVENPVPETLDRDLGATSVNGTVTAGNGTKYADFNGYITLKSPLDPRYEIPDVQIPVTEGAIPPTSVLPGTYSAGVYTVNGALLNTVTLTIPAGVTDKLAIPADGGTVSVTVNDQFGGAASDGIKVIATETTTGATFSAVSSSGVAKINATAGTYSISIDSTVAASDGASYVTDYSSTVVLAAGKNGSATITAYRAVAVNVTGCDARTVVTLASSAFRISAVASPSAVLYVPALGNATYTAYAVSGDAVYTNIVEITDADSSVQMKLASAEGAEISGTVTYNENAAVSVLVFVSDNNHAEYTFSTGSDGEYTAHLPKGAYTVFAYDSDKHVSNYQEIDTKDTKELDLSLADGKQVVQHVEYTFGSTAKAVPFTNVFAELACSGSSYLIPSMTDTDGKAVFHVPKDAKVCVSVDAISEGYYDGTPLMKVDSGSPIVLTPAHVAIPASHDGASLYKPDSIAPLSGSVAPGNYRLKIEGKDGYYRGDVSIYPSTASYAIKPYESAVEIAISDGWSVSITAIENSDGKTGAYYHNTIDGTSTKSVWYIEAGYDYLFTITGDGKTAYYSVSDAKTGTKYTPAPELSETVILSGNVGCPADGTLAVAYGDVTVTVPIKDGGYSVAVPKNTALKISATTKTTGSSSVYVSSAADISIPPLDKDTVRNFSVVNSSSTHSSAAGLAIDETSSLVSGTGTVKLAITNNESYGITYLITGSPCLALDRAYSKYVAAGETEPVDLTVAHYSPSAGAGTSDMSITVTAVDGTSVGTAVVPAKCFGDKAAGGDLAVKTAKGGASADSANNSAYRYAFTLINKGAAPAKASFEIRPVGSENWEPYIVSEDGHLIQSLRVAADVHVAGHSTDTAYVMLVNPNGEGPPKASINYTISGDFNSKGKLSPQTISLSVGGASVSGDRVDNSKAELSSAFWALTAVTAILLFVFLWAATKRGVFIRKN